VLTVHLLFPVFCVAAASCSCNALPFDQIFPAAGPRAAYPQHMQAAPPQHMQAQYGQPQHSQPQQQRSPHLVPSVQGHPMLGGGDPRLASAAAGHSLGGAVCYAQASCKAEDTSLITPC
jgi:hypothetical protein